MKIAGQLECRRLCERTEEKFSMVPYIDLSQEIKDMFTLHADKIDAKVDHTRNERFDYFAIKTLMRSYLCKDKQGNIIESPQHMWMRVALGIHGNDLDSAFETYDAMSLGFFVHASPTLFNSATTHPSLASCYLVGIKDDSLSGIFDTVKDVAMISRSAGGVGLHIHQIRGTGSHISGTGGTSNGVLPMIRVFNNVGRYVDQ